MPARADLPRAPPNISPRSISARVDTWEFPLKTLPRPTGRATRVIIPSRISPRETIEPHDVIVDEDGIAWYSNFGEQTFGRLDPKTGKAQEYPVAAAQEGLADRHARPARRQGRQHVARQ